MQDNLPNHVAIIPDGNRRWAKEQGLKPWDGHYEGAKRFEELVDEAFSLNIKNISFWGSSEDNLTKRPLREKKALLDIYETYFKKLVRDKKIFEKNIKINIIGKWKEQFPGKLIKLLEEGIEKTKNHDGFNLNFLLAYSGNSDIITATENIIELAKEGTKLEIDDSLISNSLMTSNLPMVDLVIRTGTENDPHNSAGFLMWQTQNSQLYFTDLKFPDFTAKKLTIALEDFSQRARRLGK
jgi:undecaprenyl diphosphate synthase